nr:Lrp/AsnC family transcriptional regulator [Nocardioides sp. IC4_145]
MKSSSPRTAFTGVPSGALISGTPKKARKYIEAVSRSIRRPGSEVTRRILSERSRTATSADPQVRVRSPQPVARVTGVSTGDVETTDRHILELLATDGRMSFTDLGKATGLSTSAVHQRVKRLEQRGLILGYGATIDHEQVGLPLTAFISIRPIDPSQPDDSPERLSTITEIESCWSVAGEESYILKVRTETPSALEGLLARIRAAANVNTRTTIVLNTFYENRPVSAAEPDAG